MVDRIIITGPHSCGKTTLARALSNRLGSKFQLIEEVARRVMERDGWTREDVPKVEFQKAIQLQQILEESQCNLPYIADRCIIDPIAYTKYKAVSDSCHTDLFQTPHVKELLEHYRDDRKSLIILCEPVEAFAVDDGVRALVESTGEWWKLCETFEEVLGEAGCQFERMGKAMLSAEARVEQVDRWIKARSFEVQGN